MTNNRRSHSLVLFLCTICIMLIVLVNRTLAGETGSIVNASADGKTLQLIQFKGPTQDAWLETVEATGAEVIHYAGDFAYLVWVGEPARSQIERLAAKNDFLRFTTSIKTSQKLDRTLQRQLNQEAAAERIIVTIQMLRHEGRQETEKKIEALVVEPLSAWEPVLNYQNLKAVVTSSAVERIAQLPDVVWVGAYYTPKLMDERQGQIMAGFLDRSQAMPAGPGYLNWLKERGFSDDPQKYPIIDITDDGIGNGNAATAAGDLTFRITGNPNLSSRLTYLKNCTEAADASGPNGHGHLNASIAGGYDTRAGEPFQDSLAYQHGMGINPFGRLAGTRVFNGAIFESAGCGSSYLSILKQSYQSGARIINNSWGCTVEDCTSQYNATAQAYDTAVRDADDSTPGNQELLILFSAGNVGSPGSVGSPANAKNVLTVGGSENVRPSWTDNCGIGPTQADNLQDIWIRSSRGPAPGGRVKPDLVAPGTHVTGTASTSPSYNGSNICNEYYPPSQQLFTASSGTSHSAPAVAGFASLASFWLSEKYGIENPSPALLKAYLITNTRHLTGSDGNDDLPSNNQGFGLPDMRNAFDERARIIFDQEQTPLLDDSGQSWSLHLHAADKTQPVRVVMAFTDAPGILLKLSNDPLHPRVNDLDLVVQTDGMTYLGNEMNGPWSKTGGEADSVNTVEAVFLPPGAASLIEVQIIGTLIAGDGVPGVGDSSDQDFVLICDNCKASKPNHKDYQLFLPVLIP